MIIPAPSLNRLLANIANSRKSTGPKSVAGKARSSQNAITHGLTANGLLAPGESADRLLSHLDLVSQDLGPQTYLETLLALRVGAATWRLFRCDSFESGLIDNQLAVSEHTDNTPGTVARAWAQGRPELALRYQAAHQNKLQQNLQAFLGISALRQNGMLPDGAEPAQTCPLPPTTEVLDAQPLLAEAHQFPNEAKGPSTSPQAGVPEDGNEP